MGIFLATIADLQKDLTLRIEKALENLDIPEEPVSVYEPYRYALSVGGKRIRPLLTLLSSGLCGGEIDDAMPAALAVEILHNFTLVHDDIMDSAETRRGKASVFKKWNTNVAILSGDLMFADACRQLSFYAQNDAYSKEAYSEMHRIFLKTTITVCEGQALDIEYVHLDNISREQYLKMISGKTAALLSGALEMGAIAANESIENRKLLASLGIEMGIAFQIQDDLLDAIADPEKFGKKPGGDIFEGKKTYLTILALERADSEQAKIINQVLNQNSPTEDQVQQVLDILHDLNVMDDVALEIQKHYDEALNLLRAFKPSPYKQELENLLNFLKNRDH